MKLLSLILLYVISLLILVVFPSTYHPGIACIFYLISYIVLYLIVFKCAIPTKLVELKSILIIAIVIRVLFLWLTPGTDVYRYAWEGKKVAQGINPYINAPLWFTIADIKVMSKKDKVKIIELINLNDIKNESEFGYETITDEKILNFINNLLKLKNLKNYLNFYSENSKAERNIYNNILKDPENIQQNRELLIGLFDSLQDDIQMKINHKELTAIYPPITILTFSFLMKIYYSISMFKIFFFICDIIGVVILFFLLKYLNKPLHWSYLYIMSPLVLYYGVGECHVDVLQSVFLLASIYFILTSRTNYWLALGFFLLGCAVLIKYLAIIALPFLVKKKNIYFLIYFFIPFLSYLIFIDQHMFSSLFLFSGNMHFNDAIPRILRFFLRYGIGYNFFMVFIFFTIYIIIFLFFQDEPIKGILLTWLWLVLCMPILHPWYLITCLLLMCLYPQRNILYLALTMCSYFFVMNHYELKNEWVEFWWLPVMTYGGFCFVAIFERNKLPSQFTFKREGSINIKSLDIIVPVLNEQKEIDNMLKSLFNEIGTLNKPNLKINVYIVDGGSKDSTIEISKKYPVNILHSSKKGRGHQLALGFESSIGDLVLFLHADSIVKINALRNLIENFEFNSTLDWGILGHKYDVQSIKLKLIEFLNNLRFNYLGIAFGDQGIFIRRKLLAKIGVPKMQLMEDIELSLRLHCSNNRLNLNGWLTGSARRWENRRFINSFIQVVFLSFYYTFRRKMGVNINTLSEKMYNIYYK